MHFFHFKLFRDIAVAGSMSKGAALNEISQSAASQHVQELERGLGLELIDRSVRPIQLTEAGKLYLELCKEVLRARDEFEMAAGQLKTSVEGTVRVASIFSVGLVEMARLEREFAARYPKASLEVEYLRPEKVYAAVREGAADIGLVSYGQSTKDIAAIPWREEEMGVAASPGHPVAMLQVVHAKDLEGLEFIAFDTDLPIRKEVDRFLKEHDVTVKLGKHFDSIPLIKEALAVGQSVSILPVRMLRTEIAEDRLVCVPLEAPGLIRPLHILQPKKKRMTRAMGAFLDLLQEAEQPVPVG